MNEVENGFCKCGCKEKTELAKYPYKRWGIKRGEPLNYIRGHAIRVPGAVFEPRLCACGCGNFTGKAVRNNPKCGVKKGQANLYCMGHSTNGFKHSKESRMKMSKAQTGKEAIFSPFIPDLIVNFMSDKKRWACRNIFNKEKCIQTTHAKVVYQYFKGPVPEGYMIHHKNSNPSNILSDHPDNLLAIPEVWNLNYLPQLATGFGVHESVVTEAYEKLAGKVDDSDLYMEVCRELVGSEEKQIISFEIQAGLIRPKNEAA